MYGIRSDTLGLSRRVTENDIQAFVHLYPLANYHLLRQIDRPELPIGFARILSHAMRRLEIRDGLITIYLGEVERDDLIVQVADFCLQFEGVQWVAVAGKLGANLVIAVRNHGLGRANAGDLVKRLFGDIGNAGGHRNMAKAIVPMRKWDKRERVTRKVELEHRLRELFTQGILGEAETTNGRLHVVNPRGGV
jgi:nanoRNase/pAp phosphatase (c-di-AMP/oligoRNAs hydrolase)